jgi:hypothetical protein
MNAQAGPYLSKASLALPLDLEIQATDTQESIVIQANKEGIIILDSVEKPDVYVKGTATQLEAFNKDYMPVNDFLVAFGSLQLEGNTLKGKLGLKIANKIIAEKVAEAKAREAARLAAEEAAKHPYTGSVVQEQPKQPNIFYKLWLSIIGFFSRIF